MSDESGCGISLLVIAGIGAYIYWAGGIKTVWYAATYRVGIDKVQVDPEPTNCDFMHAPLGQKDCHYESTVAAYNTTGTLIGGDYAPKYGHDSNTGKPIISWDQGKTWVWFDGTEIPDQKVTSVIVSWTKKQ